MKENYQGSCMCGQVTFIFSQSTREVLACHCKECRQSSGHFVAATQAKLENFEFITQEGLKWYESSDFAKRGFCKNCGSQLFYKVNESDEMSIMAGCVESLADMKIEAHIFCVEKGSYYQIPNNEPQYERWD